MGQSLSSQKLYNLSDLAPVRTYNYELPTYTQPPRFTPREQWFENETLWENFSKSKVFTKDRYSESETFFLPEIDLSGLAIFGGSLTDILLTNHEPHDIDMAFFCDEKDAEHQGQALADRVKKFVDNCIVWMKKENKRILEKIEDGNTHYSKDMMYDLKSSDKLLITRYRNCYTIKIPCCKVPIQIIHCKNVDSLLDGIDLDHPVNFGMFEMLDLPYLNIQFNKIEGNKICGYHKPTPSSKCIEIEEGNNKLNYASGNVGSLIHNNIQNLARKEFEKFTFIGEGELYNQAFNKNVTITERMLTNTYETAKGKIWGSGELNFTEIETYLPFKPVEELVE